METRIAVIAIVAENRNHINEMNHVLSAYGEYIIGRMGLPYKERNLNIVSIAVDAPQDVISELAGKIGKLGGISVKAAYSNKIFND